jgi:tetratricopeptide (TPR) repeat protein
LAATANKFKIPMDLLSKLFGNKKKPEPSAEETQQNKKRESFDFFQKGKEFYFSQRKEAALLHFDKAFESDFIENFPTDAITFYDLRASCLQALGYDYDAIDDFDKSILLAPDDCNKYFSRSLSKLAILDYQGAISDIEQAIEVSKIDNEHNRMFNDQAHEQGYKNGAADFYWTYLQRAKMDLESESEYIKTIENAASKEEKQYRQEMYDERRENKLKRVIRR